MKATRWPQKGDKMRFLGRNGYESELELATRYFNTEDEYEVDQFSLGIFSSRIYFVDVPFGWNSVMFDFADPNLSWEENEVIDTGYPYLVRDRQLDEEKGDIVSDWKPWETAPKDRPILAKGVWSSGDPFCAVVRHTERGRYEWFIDGTLHPISSVNVDVKYWRDIPE